MKTIKYNGYKFNKDEHTGYYLSSRKIDGGRVRLHRYVWATEQGPIPDGMHVHHIDGDKDNNDISNLALLSTHDHEQFHGKKRFMNNTEWAKEFQDKGEEAAKGWHHSQAGHDWHKEHYLKTKSKLHSQIERKCVVCGKLFMGILEDRNRFCSNKCKSKWRRDSGIDNVERVCVICGKRFETNKYNHRQTCSRSCSAKRRWNNRSES